MPVSKKRKKEGKKRPRERGGVPGPQAAPGAPSAPPESGGSGGGGGFLTRMRGGFQSMAGAGGKKESLLSKIVTWAIVVLAAYFVARRFGILRWP